MEKFLNYFLVDSEERRNLRLAYRSEFEKYLNNCDSNFDPLHNPYSLILLNLKGSRFGKTLKQIARDIQNFLRLEEDKAEFFMENFRYLVRVIIDLEKKFKLVKATQWSCPVRKRYELTEKGEECLKNLKRILERKNEGYKEKLLEV